LQVATLEGNEFGALLEQRSAVERLQRETVLDGLLEGFHHFSADVLLGEHGREFQDGFVLGKRRQRENRGRRDGCAEKAAPIELECHRISSLWPVVARQALLPCPSLRKGSQFFTELFSWRLSRQFLL
jgi:hypothetical protein